MPYSVSKCSEKEEILNTKNRIVHKMFVSEMNIKEFRGIKKCNKPIKPNPTPLGEGVRIGPKF